MSFAKSFEQLLRDESITLSNGKFDRGGVTFAGITRKNFPDWNGWAFLDATPQNQEMAIFWTKDFYQRWWSSLSLDAFGSDEVANSLFSYSVNAGVTQAVKDLQRACNYVAFCTHANPFKTVSEDGKPGKDTLAAVNHLHMMGFDKDLLREYGARKTIFRTRLILNDKTQLANCLGWARRDMGCV